jgi:hypothetical protein
VIAVLALLSASQAADLPTEPAAEPPVRDIVVMNRMLDAVVFRWRGDKVDGQFRMTSCYIVRSSGDAEVDAITCKSTRECLVVLPGLRKQRGKSPFDACLTRTRKRMITELFDARAQAAAELGQ